MAALMLALMVASGLAAKFRNLVLATPMQALWLGTSVVSERRRSLHSLGLGLVLLSNVWGSAQVIAHTGTLKNSWNLPVAELKAYLQRRSFDCEGDLVVLAHDPTLDWQLRREGYEVVSPRHPEERSGIVTFRVPGTSPQALWKALLSRNAVCSPRIGGIRVSPHFYNTSEEIALFFEILREEAEAQRAAAGGTE